MKMGSIITAVVACCIGCSVVMFQLGKQYQKAGEMDVMIQTVKHNGHQYIVATKTNSCAAPSIIHDENCPAHVKPVTSDKG